MLSGQKKTLSVNVDVFVSVSTNHGGRHAVNVLSVQMAPPVVGLHDSSQPTVQSHVGFGI